MTRARIDERFPVAAIAGLVGTVIDNDGPGCLVEIDLDGEIGQYRFMDDEVTILEEMEDEDSSS